MTKMDPSASPAKDARLIELDALRGLGAVTVVLYHLTTRFHEIFPNADHAPVYLWGGEYRVLLFFAISGFAIFFTMNHTASAADFVMNRVSRLFPAYWVAICLTVAFEYFGRVKMLQVSPTEAMLNFTMLQGYLYVRPVDGAYWTLAYELGFYASMLAIWKGPGFARLERICFGWLALKWLLWLWPDMPGRIATLLVLKFVPFFIIGMAFQRIWAGHRPPHATGTGAGRRACHAVLHGNRRFLSSRCCARRHICRDGGRVAALVVRAAAALVRGDQLFAVSGA